MKDFKPIKLELAFHYGGEMKMIGRKPKDRPYISVKVGDRYACVPDRAVRRLRRWCNEILKEN